METCKAIIQVGERKGQRCQFPPNETLYCKKHLRNKKYDDGIAEGIKWCRFFFRGCDTQIVSGTSCQSCKEKLCKKTLKCHHEGCTFKVEEGTFCKKHERDKYRLEEKEKGITFCDIDRGCFTIVTDTKSCAECLEKARAKDNERYKNKKQMFIAAQTAGTNARSCVGCGKEFEAFLTRYGKESFNCTECQGKQAKHDEKRDDRARDYNQEHSRNIEGYYKIYVNNALERGYGDFELSCNEFSEMIQKPCHYCKGTSNIQGVDRINNNIGYTKENCVSACWTCNRMKCFYHPEFFIMKCKIILKTVLPENFYKTWSAYYGRSSNKNYKNYKKVSEEERGLPFELSQSQWDMLTRSPCHYCGYQDEHGIGIDRIDNTIRKYTLTNCVACCGSCNIMKNELPLDVFMETCLKIANAWPEGSFSHIPNMSNPLKAEENLSKRIHWKAEGVYYCIISKSDTFIESNKGIITPAEYNTLCKEILPMDKTLAINTLKTFLVKVKKRRNRLASYNPFVALADT